jgi:hypothetical protein
MKVNQVPDAWYKQQEQRNSSAVAAAGQAGSHSRSAFGGRLPYTERAV